MIACLALSSSSRGVPSEPVSSLSNTLYRVSWAFLTCEHNLAAKRAAFLEVSEKSTGTINWFMVVFLRRFYFFPNVLCRKVIICFETIYRRTDSDDDFPDFHNPGQRKGL